MRFRTGGPDGTVRPYVPGLTTDETERRGEALDHIARSLSAIDHNLEVLTNAVTQVAHLLAKR